MHRLVDSSVVFASHLSLALLLQLESFFFVTLLTLCLLDLIQLHLLVQLCDTWLVLPAIGDSLSCK